MKLERYICIDNTERKIVWLNYYNEDGLPTWRELSPSYVTERDSCIPPRDNSLEDMLRRDIGFGRKIISDPKEIDKYLMILELKR